VISFFTEGVELEEIDYKKIKNWIVLVAKNENFSISNVIYVFSTDEYLLKINKEYLKHDYYTDIITFPYSNNSKIEAEIFISIDRVIENAKLFNNSFKEELLRVIIHGILHIVGYNDSTENEKKKMRKKENLYLDYFFNDTKI